MIISKAVVPVAGQGTRLLPATKSQPKEMLPVGRKPVVQYVIEELGGQGLSDVLLVTGAKKHAIEDHFDTDPMLMARLQGSGDEELLSEVDLSSQGVRLAYTRQAVPAGRVGPLGLGDAIRHGRGFVGNEPFVVALGDTIIHSDGPMTLVERLIKAHQDHDATVTIAVWEVEAAMTRRYGVVAPAGSADDVFQIEDIVEKPEPEAAPSRLAVAARYVFDPVIFDVLDQTELGHGGELQLTDGIRNIIQSGHKVMCVRLRDDETRYDIGNYETYFKAFIDFALRDREYGKNIASYIADIVRR